ncbi:glycoside hydrolase family 43 protein [Alkalicoccus chagannorensis]|uniref:glycoside hydrolase family 43 protein n=1 Tax=Alkalicoccus chagannorensis TaxID=427072 RepID=UPI00041A3419|nr:glycoside hydrolase family 43 protein [Alkalicoccus chagannorensis]
MQITNPILTGFNPDPSVCRAGDDYYIAVSTFEWFPGVRIYHSKDLKHWTFAAAPLNRLSQLNMKGNPDSGGVWAPQLSWADGKFWLIYSDVKVTDGQWKDNHNYLVTCETIDGEWSDPVYLNGSGFDPSLFHDEDGRKYLTNMVWDPRVGNHPFYGIALQEYDPVQEKLTGDIDIIFKGTEHKLTEAPHLYKKDGWYYLLTAEGGTTYNHLATIARSRQLRGPYEVRPDNPLLTSWDAPDNELQKAGHASMVETPDGEWFLFHLTGRPLPRRKHESRLDNRGFCPLGRETAVQRVFWEQEWPYVENGPNPSLVVEGPDLPEQPVEDSRDFHYTFEHGVSSDFQTLRIPLGEDICSTEARPGWLRLSGRESLTSSFTQAFTARRWQSMSFTAETKLEAEPVTFQQSAGLVNYYNTKNWTALQLTWDEEKGRILDLSTCDNFTFDQPLQEKIDVPEGSSVWLRVTVDVHDYWYSYSFDGKTWTDIDLIFPSYKLSDDYVEGGGFFTGAFTGMQCQDTSGRGMPADFAYFRYTEKPL